MCYTCLRETRVLLFHNIQVFLVIVVQVVIHVTTKWILWVFMVGVFTILELCFSSKNSSQIDSSWGEIPTSLSKTHISRVRDYTVGYSPELGAYMCKYMWILPRTRGVYVKIYVKLPRFQGKCKYIPPVNGVYIK